MSRAGLTLATAAALVAAIAAARPASAAKGKKVRPRLVVVQTPLGVQGRSGAGANVGIGFVVAWVTGRPVDVQMEFGRDRDGDGTIADGEFRTATEDRLDPRDSRANLAPQLFPTSSGSGTSNVIVWRSDADVGIERIPLVERLLTLQGREIPDPSVPGGYVLANGPSGTPILSGVQVRLRTVTRRSGKGRKARFDLGPWVVSDRFALDNAAKPSMRIDSVTSGAPVLAEWTAFSADSEDFDGDGVLEFADGEDVNGNGVLDGDRVGVAFDWHRLAPGEDPQAMTAAQLESLAWSPCTRRFGVGDTDSLDARPGVPVPTSGDFAGVQSAGPGSAGRRVTFAWDVARDAGTGAGSFILRATPFCQHRARGATVYSRIVGNSGP